MKRIGRRLPRLVLVVGIVTSNAACRGCGAARGHRANEASASTASFPAPHPGAPRVTPRSGAVLVAPRIVPIVFAGDPMLSMLARFSTTIGASAYWKVLSEYGVGEATASAPVIVDANELGRARPRTITAAEIATFLSAHLDGKHAAWGAPNASAIYVLFYPEGVSVRRDGATSCGFTGYHGALPVGAVNVAFAVVPRCETAEQLHGEDAITGVASRELVEAATDPLAVAGSLGHPEVDREHVVYSLFPAGEIVDMCTDSDAYFTFAEFPFAVQRVWSNDAAAAGKDPCVPHVPGHVYFAAAPVLNDDVKIEAHFAGDVSAVTKGVKVPVGQSRQFDIALFSAAETDAFAVRVVDLPTLLHRGRDLTFTLDHTTGRNGDRLRATVTRLKDGPYGGTEFVVEARGAEAPAEFHRWFGFAAN